MSITINKETDNFFIALCMQNSHSFLMFGIYDQNRVTHLLCRVGKVFDLEPITGCLKKSAQLGRVLFSNSKAKLNDEGISRQKKGQHPISYQAYDTTYQHYLEFIHLLESLQTEDNGFICYKPSIDEDDDNNEVLLNLTHEKIFNTESELGNLKQEVNRLGLRNTCRHTAIKLVEEIQHVPHSTMVSSVFFKNLPYTTELDYGKPSSDIPFYVLPISPIAYSPLGVIKQRVLTKLYSRMESLLLIDPYSVETQIKFHHLKELYADIIGPKREVSLNELLINIKEWKSDHQIELNVLRKTYFLDKFFTRRSATAKMLCEIEGDLQRAASLA